MNMQLDLTKKPTHKEKVLHALKTHKTVSNTYFNEVLHIYRYSARVDDLRNEGYEIESKHIKGGVWEFTLKGEPSGR